MRLRWKLLLLLLSVSLAPILLLRLSGQWAMSELGDELGSVTRHVLVRRAVEELGRLVEDHAIVLRRERDLLTLTLENRAAAAAALCSPTSSMPGSFMLDLEDAEAVATQYPFPVSLDSVSIHPGDGGEVLSDQRLELLASMGRDLLQRLPGLVIWQYVVLDNGFAAVFPGHQDISPQWRPREREWYLAGKQEGPRWVGPVKDPFTGEQVLFLVGPVPTFTGFADGSGTDSSSSTSPSGGVVCFAVSVSALLSSNPGHHGTYSVDQLLVEQGAGQTPEDGGFRVIARNVSHEVTENAAEPEAVEQGDDMREALESTVSLERAESEMDRRNASETESVETATAPEPSARETRRGMGMGRGMGHGMWAGGSMSEQGWNSGQGWGHGQGWRFPDEQEPLLGEEARSSLSNLLRETSAGEGSVQLMEFEGENSLWAFGPVTDTLALVFIVSESDITADAAGLSEQVQDRIRRQMILTGVSVAVVLVVVLIISAYIARRVAGVVADMGRAFERVAEGDFTARAPVRSKDELGDLARTFNRMAPALEDRMRMKESLGLAREVQSSLLPSGPPEVAGLDVAGVSVSCDETGGDLYDYITYDEQPGLLTAIVGDVTGHGAAAALLMSSLRSLLRCRLRWPEDLPAAVEDVNSMAAADTFGTGRFMTLFALQVDGLHKTLRWVGAGHDPALLYDPAADAFNELVGRGVPLGAVEDFTHEADERSGFVPGQLICISTDGVWETHNRAGEMFGKDRLREVLRENVTKDAQSIIDAVLQALETFAAGGGDADESGRSLLAREDDVTLIIIKSAPPTGPEAVT